MDLPCCSSTPPSYLQVSLSPEDLQALGSAISVVTQHRSTTLTIPGHQEELATSGTHTVTMVSADGTQTQPVRSGRFLVVWKTLSWGSEGIQCADQTNQGFLGDKDTIKSLLARTSGLGL